MNAKKHVLIIQNDAEEGAGILLGLLARSDISQTTLFGWNLPQDISGLYDYSALIVLGGAQSVYQQHEFPYLITEIELCRHYIEADKAVLGICLGAQILAEALGSEVKPNTEKEIGWYDLHLTKEGVSDPILTQYPVASPAFHFHGDYFATPPTCERLAKSDLTECQAFRFGIKIYGFQYHLEVDQKLIEIMCRRNSDYMAANGLDTEHVIEESKTNILLYQQDNNEVLKRWLMII